MLFQELFITFSFKRAQNPSQVAVGSGGCVLQVEIVVQG
jgi:hypothetical protein